MDYAKKLPAMEDRDLANLRANAARLMESGSTIQKAAASALLPSIDAELAVRSAAIVRKKAEALAARRSAKAKSNTDITG